MTRSAKRRAWREKQRDAKPYSKGRAIVDARAILGPDAHVRRSGDHIEIGRFNEYGFRAQVAAETFKAAIAELRKQQDAQYLGRAA